MKQGSEGGPSPIGGNPDPAADTPVAISEEVVWKARAEQAEEELAAALNQIDDLKAQLEAATHAAGAEHARRNLEHELARAGAIDTEACLLLIESSDLSELDPASQVAELRRRRPHLFRQPAPSAPGATRMPHAPSDELTDMADRARTTGDRAALLRYLRRRRA